jgi:hypothetical protein
MNSGELTGRIGHDLTERLKDHGFDVLYDHGKGDAEDQNVGRIASWFGDKLSFQTRLALIDIAIVESSSNRAFALIEIEETSSDPKVILGDVFGTLLGDRISFRDRGELTVGNFTTLFVFVAGDKDRVDAKINHLSEHLNSLKENMTSENASLRIIFIHAFSNEDDLRSQLNTYIETELLLE